jgi:hypothetical protein
MQVNAYQPHTVSPYPVKWLYCKTEFEVRIFLNESWRRVSVMMKSEQMYKDPSRHRLLLFIVQQMSLKQIFSSVTLT